jgi:hypothetical protein
MALMKSIERVRNPDAIRVRPGRRSRKGTNKEAPTDTKVARGGQRRRGNQVDHEDKDMHEVPFLALTANVSACACHFAMSRCVMHAPASCLFSSSSSSWMPQ